MTWFDNDPFGMKVGYLGFIIVGLMVFLSMAIGCGV